MIGIGADVPSQRAFSSSLPPPASSLCQTGGSVVFVQMDQQTIADYPVGGAATTPTFRYVYASYIDEPVVRTGPTSTSTAHFYHRNHQYSVTAGTTSTGAIAERYAYTAYGQPTILNASGTPLSPQTSTLNSRYSYTGREWDATLGLHHFRARWMSPGAGRFLGRDPIGYEGSDWGLYEYVEMNPLGNMDPSGLKTPRNCTAADHAACNAACLAQKGRGGKAISCWTAYIVNTWCFKWGINGNQCKCAPRKKKDDDDGKDDGKGMCVLLPGGAVPPAAGNSCWKCKYKCTGTRYMNGGQVIERYQKGGCHGNRKWVWGYNEPDKCEGNEDPDGEPVIGLEPDDVPWNE